jgi:hypothetical protein
VLGEREGPPGPALADTEPRDSVGGRGPPGFSYILPVWVVYAKGFGYTVVIRNPCHNIVWRIKMPPSMAAHLTES